MTVKKKTTYEEGIIIPLCDHQIQLVRDIVSLPDEQRDLLNGFVKLMKANNNEQE